MTHADFQEQCRAPMGELLPCPFCGGDAEYNSWDQEDSEGNVNGYGWNVKCINDDCTFKPSAYSSSNDDPPLDLHQEWDTRTPADGENEWQPIESSPRDGTLILVAQLLSTSDGGEGWWNYDVGKWIDCGFSSRLIATHWQPIKPPKVAHD